MRSALSSETFGNVHRHVWSSQLMEGGERTSGRQWGERLEMLWNILQCTRLSVTTKDHPAWDVNGAEAEEPQTSSCSFFCLLRHCYFWIIKDCFVEWYRMLNNLPSSDCFFMTKLNLIVWAKLSYSDICLVIFKNLFFLLKFSTILLNF